MSRFGNLELDGPGEEHLDAESALNPDCIPPSEVASEMSGSGGLRGFLRRLFSS
jgi:hypothetical protein